VNPRVSVIIPVYNEGEDVVRHLERILREVLLPAEILVVHDMPEDTTVPYAQQIACTTPGCGRC
jgi:dolichol-phosphate mannosyltransferase